jgi:hypothetical protein
LFPKIESAPGATAAILQIAIYLPSKDMVRQSVDQANV